MEENKEIIEEQKPKLTYDELKEKYDELQSEVSEAHKAIKEGNDLLLKQVKQIEELNDKYLRALADYQNLKRVSDATIAKSKDSGKISIFKDLLPIIDDFEKAKEAGELTEGVEFIYNKIINVFKSNNVSVIDPKEGDVFDDTIHEAVAAVPNSGNEKNTIIFTQFKGYKMGDNILRYAKVAVAV